MPDFLRTATCCALALALLATVTAHAQVPGVFNYQGRLLANDAVQAPIDGTVDIRFSIWSGPTSDTAATELWAESWSGVNLENGIFNVLLGSNGSPLDPSDFQGDSTLFLELQIDGETLAPRQQLGAAPFAIVDEPGNERQDLTRAGDALQLTDSSASVDLSDFRDNTDNQVLSLTGSSLALTSDDGIDIVDLSALDNAPQDLELDGATNQLSLTDDPTPVDLSPFLDNTDNQVLTLVADSLQLSSEDGTDVIDLTPYLDDTDNQVLTINASALQLTSDDGTDVVDLTPFLDNTDAQTLTLSGASLTISGSGSTVGLAGFLDNTDNQVLSISGTQLRLTSDDGIDVVDLAGLNTDNQTLSLSGATLSISGSGSSVSLASFLDDQDLADVLFQGNDAGDRDMTNLNSVDIDQLRIDNDFECNAATADCVRTEHIEQDTIGGNDITDNVYIVWIDCNGSCADMSLRDACDTIEVQRGLSTQAELIGVSCVYNVPSTTGNGFTTCPVQSGSDNECRSFNLRTLGDIPCIDGDGTDAIVTCLATDIPL